MRDRQALGLWDCAQPASSSPHRTVIQVIKPMDENIMKHEILMLFNSLDFAIFLSLFFFAYQALRKRVTARNVLILGGSYLFYGCWDLRFLLLIVISTAVDYLAAIMIERGRVSGRVRAATSGYVLLGAMFFVGVDWSGGLLAPKVLATSQAGWIVGICGSPPSLPTSSTHSSPDSTRPLAARSA